MRFGAKAQANTEAHPRTPRQDRARRTLSGFLFPGAEAGLEQPAEAFRARYFTVLRLDPFIKGREIGRLKAHT